MIMWLKRSKAKNRRVKKLCKNFSRIAQSNPVTTDPCIPWPMLNITNNNKLQVLLLEWLNDFEIPLIIFNYFMSLEIQWAITVIYELGPSMDVQFSEPRTIQWATSHEQFSELWAMSNSVSYEVRLSMDVQFIRTPPKDATTNLYFKKVPRLQNNSCRETLYKSYQLWFNTFTEI